MRSQRCSYDSQYKIPFIKVFYKILNWKWFHNEAFRLDINKTDSCSLIRWTSQQSAFTINPKKLYKSHCFSKYFSNISQREKPFFFFFSQIICLHFSRVSSLKVNKCFDKFSCSINRTWMEQVARMWPI